MENLSKDEVPPEYMWPFEEELELWFERVEDKRKERYGIEDNDSSDRNEQGPGMMMGNDFAKGRG